MKLHWHWNLIYINRPCDLNLIILPSRNRNNMAQDELVLLDCWVSPFCMRVKIALTEKGVPFEVRAEENLLSAKSLLLLASNPVHKKVPVLLYNGKPICESTIILGFIDETWASPPLLPPCAYGKAQARFWADFIDKKVFDGGKAIWTSKGEVEVEAAKDAFIETLKQLEETLGEKDFFGCNNAFGFVDITLIAITSWFLAYEKFGGFKVEEHCPKLSAWIYRCKERDSVSKTLPDSQNVYEFVVMLRKMFGVE
ncbi:probable glutathione S-transferase [Impatiens glandulifera]|uniref:probable glutathione S-transferase n=1 Tax=Impatiens glandulifera TaxID=253017 RepID=UPI001FB06E71|nr:probable glutathione S-transferase [Impatiens glandulifera]